MCRVTWGSTRTLAVWLLILGSLPLSGQQPQDQDLTQLDLEDLLNVEITSVSRRPERLLDAAAAISVITAEDMQRMGAFSIPEALRVVPGLNVAHVNANQWAISSRGFQDQFANKLQVLMDGRVLYTPLFSGTLWDVQDTFLQDLDRIEVIRGPGATLWGSNAVNGVINIITKSAEDTLGGLAFGTIGTEEAGAGGVRYGFKLEDDLFARVYVKYFNRDSFRKASGGNAGDESNMVRTGFRMDWQPDIDDHLTFQGDAYNGNIGEELNVLQLTAPFSVPRRDHQDVAGGNVLMRWTHEFDPTSQLQIQMYYDRTERSLRLLREDRNTIDLDVQQSFHLGDSHNLVAGLGHRVTWDDIDGTFGLNFRPANRANHLWSAFIQDDIALSQDTLFLTVGAKFEINDFTGLEIQPAIKLRWQVDEHNMLWAAVSRAVSSPSREKHDIRATTSVIPDPLGGPPTFLTLLGQANVDSEQLLAFELGYKVRPLPTVSLDLALFYNDYKDLVGQEQKSPMLIAAPIPHVVIPFARENNIDGETYGAELSAEWQVLDNWRLLGSFSYLELQLHASGSASRALNEADEGQSPEFQWNIRSFLDITRDISFTAALFYVDDLPSLNVPSYLRLDAQVSWRPTDDLTLTLGAQNLLDDRHPEFGSSFITTARESERTVYFSVELKF